MGEKRTIGGNVSLSPADWQTVSGLAKEGVVSRAKIKDLNGQLADTKKQLSAAKKEIKSLKDAFNRLYEETKVFLEAVKAAPKRVMAFLQEIISRGHKQRESSRDTKTKGNGQEL
jgi:chromosome segregation ATPase